MNRETNNPILELLKTRRSVKPDMLVEPAPSPTELDLILTIAARVPDHKKLVPWRFVILEGEARARLGAIAAQICREEEAEPPSRVRLETEASRFQRAPLVVAVVSRVVETRGAPEWEQVLSAGAAAFNLCLAANALGYGTCWVTEWVAYNAKFGAAFGLESNERIAGFIHIGTPRERPDDRERPDMAAIVSRWQS